jgi:hypothetical protein
MKIHEDYITLFESYSENSMIDTDKVSFEARLAYDEEFKKQFSAFNQLEAGIKKHFSSEIKQKLSALDDELDTNASAEVYQAPPSKWRLWIPLAGLAASILLVLMLNVIGSSTERLANKYWIKDPGLPVKMSAKGSYDNAMNHYKLGNWEQSLAELKKIDSDTSTYFQGQVLFKMGKNPESLKELQQIPEESVYRIKSIFCEALLLIQLDKISEGKILLETISNGNSEYSIIAQQLLLEI